MLVSYTTQQNTVLRSDVTVYIRKNQKQLHNATRIISETVKSTPVEWLPVLTNILLPLLRRKEALLRAINKAQRMKMSLSYQMLRYTPKLRLKSRKPPWHIAKKLALSNFGGKKKKRRENWILINIINSCLVHNSNKNMQDMDLP